MKIGFIGLGIMGSNMAMNLIKKGYDLKVYNRTESKAEPLVKAGAKLAHSPAEAGKDVDIVITMLGDPTAVRNCALGKNGFLSSMKKNSLWVDCTTVNPSFSKEMNEKAKEKGIRFMDAPVGGTRMPAEKGELVFFVGGNKKDLDEAKQLFEVMGKAINHMGKVGMGTSTKMIFNLMLGVNMVAFSETVVLGESLGIPKEKILDIMIGSISAPPFLSYKRNKMETGRYDPDFPLQWMYKDLQLVSTTGYENSVSLPTTNAAKEIFALAKRQGMKSLDFSSVYEFMRKLQVENS
jgi:3-hydroxyisobutyrate dehydrogenase-like beta-hydroxyacid dehydrogenase